MRIWKGYKQDIEGYLQDIAGYKQNIAALTVENDKFKEDLSGYHRIHEGYKEDLDKKNQDIIGYTQNIKALNSEIERLKEDIARAPDLVTFAQLQARYEGLQENRHTAMVFLRYGMKIIQEMIKYRK